ncbi:MAG: anaerobic glycerol-3-phosphate dehydrogenase subunit C [Candidatus Omnitrophica bacterium]|nr:anaerobic glycerol-3-phosphate dehydrogenase subunit C [Candidatus Omnitrophota bacterium]MDD5546452.1 anaerobic glycerol-3-phosphate dehydrogenase subunit C [Candidatus Omnitrophota bacterium]
MTLLEKELRKIIKGDVLFDDLTRHIYSFGASIYKIRPKGIVIPKDKDDVAALVKYAFRNNIPLTARGACTSLAGQAVGNGIIIDFTKYMNKAIDYKGGDTATVQPGIVYGELNKLLARYGKFFPPDPSSGDYCTIGGMIADNSGGPHSVKYGTTADWVLELEAVLANGDRVILSPRVKIKDISIPLAELLKNSEEVIKRSVPRVMRSSSGYNVYDILKGDWVDLVKLMAGSEGTLAIITEAKLRLAPLVGMRASLLLFLKDLQSIADIVAELRGLSASAIEFMDETFIKLAVEAEPKLRDLLQNGAKGVLLVELEENSTPSLDGKIDAVKGRLLKERKLISGMSVARDADEQDRLWGVRRAAVPITNRIKGKKRPVPFIEDAIVPPENLDDFIIGAYAIFEKYGVEACVYGHAGDGNMHIRPLLDMRDKEDLAKIDGIADDFYRMVISLGGSTTAEHGDGILRVPYLKKQFGPLYDIFVRIKDIFDPKGILNPGKKIGKDGTITHDLIYDAGIKYVDTKTVFDSEKIREEIGKCHACGLCRNVCPVNISLPQELASPRAKAAILKAVITGELDKRLLRDKTIKGVLDLCINCKSCRVECPTGADVSELCALAKEIYVREWGVPFSQSVLENMRFLGSASAELTVLADIFMCSTFGRRLMQSSLGLDERRLLPKPCVPPFEKRRLSGKSGRRRVAYFYGCYVNFFNADGEGAAALKVFEKNNIEVVIPRQRCCGIPSISSGNTDAVRKDISYNLKYLNEAVKSGCDIVTGCPSCGLALKEDYPRILSTPTALLVSQKTFDIHEYLWILFNEGEMNTDFKPSGKSVVFHAPCHLKAQEIGDLQQCLVELVPGVSIKKITDSCCGMGGTFGLKKENYDLSLAIGERLFRELKEANADYILTGCGACKSQISQTTLTKVIHPIEFLADHY